MGNINLTQKITQVIEQIYLKKNGGVDQAKADLISYEDETVRFKFHIDHMGASLNGIGEGFRFMGDDIVRNQKQQSAYWDNYFKGVEGAEKITNDFVKGFKAINFEFLGIMFFGQAVAKTFGDMLKPAQELFGVNELWSLMMQDLMLPVVEALMPLFMGMFDFFTELPEPVKMSLGVLASVAAVLGTIFGVVGTLVLGLQSLGTVLKLPALTEAASSIGSKMLSLLGPIGLVTAAIITAVIIWNTNFAGFRDTVKNIFEDIKDIFSGIIDFITDVFTGDWESAWDDLTGIVDSAFKIVGETVALLLDAFGKLTGMTSASDLANSIRNALNPASVTNSITPENSLGISTLTSDILSPTSYLTPRSASQMNMVNNINISVDDTQLREKVTSIINETVVEKSGTYFP